jgi:hypothetical protein
MALTVVNPGQYVLGGISAPTTNISDAFQAGLQSNLNRQSTRQQMQEREQMMRLRTSAEQRSQEMFEMQQRQAAQAAAQQAQAAAREATRRRLMAQYGGALVGGAPGLVTGAPGVGVQVPMMPATIPAAPTGADVQAPTTPAAPQLDMMPTGSIPVAPTQSYMTPDSMAARAAIGAMPVVGELPDRGVTTNPVQVEMQNAAIQRQIANIDATISATSQALNAPGSRADPTATIQRINALRQQREALAAQLQDVTYAPPLRDVTAEEGPGAAGLPPYTRPSDETGAGLREPGSESPIDFVLGQRAGSESPATNIPRETPRISAAVTQGFSERERLVEAYNAFTRAGLVDEAQNFIDRINALDQTLIRLQGEQAINDLQLGSVERASQLLSYYYGANVQPVLNSEGKYDLYVDGQPVENDDFIDLRPDQMGDVLRPFFDAQYRDAMTESRKTYLSERAKKQAERDMAEEENPGFKVDRTLTGANGETYMVLVNPTGEFRFVWFEMDANNNPVTRTRALTQDDIRNMGLGQ